MISRESIRNALLQIAENNNLSGESVNLLVNELTYALYHQQLEVTNAIQESNLSTAKLLNSKIRNCMNVMYPVYRGKNARVKLTFINNTHIVKSKFDVLYTSNTFKIYAEEKLDITQSSGANPTRTVVGILCNKDIYDNTITVTSDNRYYIDFKINQSIVSNLSEDIQVFINDTEYPTTRNFFDFIQQSISTDTPASENELFILTLPDYGIRIYKRGYFNESDEVRIRALKYTTIDEINKDEFAKIAIPGTIVTNPSDGKPTKLDITKVVKRDSSNASDANGVIRELLRDDARSLLQSANLYERLQCQILSKSDINMLFNEYFIDHIYNSINWYDGSEDFKDGSIYIFYVPKINYDEITSAQSLKFKDRYGSYFISDNLIAISGKLLTIEVQLVLYTNTSEELSNQIEGIFNEYANQLNDPDEFNEVISDTDEVYYRNTSKANVLKHKQIFADISKLPQVDYIDEFKYTNSSTDDGAIQYQVENNLPLPYIVENNIKVPTYYQFNIDIIYKSNNESIS